MNEGESHAPPNATLVGWQIAGHSLHIWMHNTRQSLVLYTSSRLHPTPPPINPVTTHQSGQIIKSLTNGARMCKPVQNLFANVIYTPIIFTTSQKQTETLTRVLNSSICGHWFLSRRIRWKVMQRASSVHTQWRTGQSDTCRLAAALKAESQNRQNLSFVNQALFSCVEM